MKQLIILTILLTAYAGLKGQTLENPGTPEERAQKITTVMIQNLSLDSSMVEPIHTLNLKYAKKAQSEVIAPDISMWSRYRKGEKLNKQKEKELQQLLSESQWDTYLKQKAAKKKEILKKIFY